MTFLRFLFLPFLLLTFLITLAESCERSHSEYVRASDVHETFHTFLEPWRVDVDGNLPTEFYYYRSNGRVTILSHLTKHLYHLNFTCTKLGITTKFTITLIVVHPPTTSASKHVSTSTSKTPTTSASKHVSTSTSKTPTHFESTLSTSRQATTSAFRVPFSKFRRTDFTTKRKPTTISPTFKSQTTSTVTMTTGIITSTSSMVQMLGTKTHIIPAETIPSARVSDQSWNRQAYYMSIIALVVSVITLMIVIVVFCCSRNSDGSFNKIMSSVCKCCRNPLATSKKYILSIAENQQTSNQKYKNSKTDSQEIPNPELSTGPKSATKVHNESTGESSL